MPIYKCSVTYFLQLELETTLRQESEAKFNLATSNLEKKVAGLEKENAELKAVSLFFLFWYVT
jgi:hypothetical protein